jgi:hypothetical protein
LPGKTETEVRAIAEEFKSRPGEYREARDRAGITLERAYYQKTPMGDFVVAYIESERPFGETTASMVNSDLAIDREFAKHVKEVHGVDLTQPPAGPPPETVGEWVNPDLSDRLPGKAFCAPLLPGVADAGRAFAREAFITRIDELTASRRELGQTVEVVTLLSTPHGDITSIYTEGKDPQESSRKFAASSSTYDKWFKDQLSTLYPPQMDFNEPSPEVTEIFDSTSLLVAR